jgi:multiple sugar transport system substrate-binding protein
MGRTDQCRAVQPERHVLGWEQAAAALAQKKAAMMDLAGFIKYGFPQDQQDQTAFSPFPEIIQGMARYEGFRAQFDPCPEERQEQGKRPRFPCLLLQARQRLGFP